MILRQTEITDTRRDGSSFKTKRWSFDIDNLSDFCRQAGGRMRFVKDPNNVEEDSGMSFDNMHKTQFPSNLIGVCEFNALRWASEGDKPNNGSLWIPKEPFELPSSGMMSDDFLEWAHKIAHNNFDLDEDFAKERFIEDLNKTEIKAFKKGKDKDLESRFESFKEELYDIELDSERGEIFGDANNVGELIDKVNAFPLDSNIRGDTRDWYDIGHEEVLVTPDGESAFEDDEEAVDEQEQNVVLSPLHDENFHMSRIMRKTVNLMSNRELEVQIKGKGGYWFSGTKLPQGPHQNVILDEDEIIMKKVWLK
jgi:hypothetical protein